MYAKLENVRRETLMGEGEAKVVIADARDELKRMALESPGRLLEIFRETVKAVPEARLVLIGTGERRLYIPRQDIHGV